MATSLTADVALLTERRYEANVAPEGDWYRANILRDDELLQAALARRGLTSVRVDWARADVDWTRFRCAVFRTTWDYFDRFDQFSRWLTYVQTRTRLCNSAALVRWNMDKHYLADLERRGVPVVPSHFIERGSALDLAALLDTTGWGDAVIKPCVSGAARHTYRLNVQKAKEVQATIQPLVASEAFLMQPFMRDIVETGEDTLMVFNGRCTHAVRKIAKPGDFRVQDDHGGTVHAVEPTAEQIELALAATKACEPAPAYGRVDMVRDNDDKLAVMEVELIEPELWLRRHPPAADNFADAIAATLEDGLERKS